MNKGFVEKIIYHTGTALIRRQMCNILGSEFYGNFKQKSKNYFHIVLAHTPDIGKSVFRLNYQFAPAYIAWYKALNELGLKQEETIRWTWNINEEMFKLLPRFLMKRYGAKIYLGGFRKKALEHERRVALNKVHEYDFHIRFRDIDSNSFGIDIYRCGIRNLCKQFDALGLFPGICRVDYMISHYMGTGFTRTKTLGDGDEVCNCVYQMKGDCEWKPEKGFENRK